MEKMKEIREKLEKVLEFKVTWGRRPKEKNGEWGEQMCMCSLLYVFSVNTFPHTILASSSGCTEYTSFVEEMRGGVSFKCCCGTSI